MKLEIYKPKEEVKIEEPVRLALKQEDETIRLVITDKYGNLRHNLIILYPDGTFIRCSNISNEYGFVLDDDKRIKER